MAHVEMLSAMMTMLMCNVCKEQVQEAGMDCWFANHNNNPFPANCNGNDWTAAYMGVTGDPIADMTNNMAAEEKARAGYEGVMKVCDDPEVHGALEFLREREIVHYQRFGEALNLLNAKLKC